MVSLQILDLSLERLLALHGSLLDQAVCGVIFMDVGNITHRFAANHPGCHHFNICEPDIRIETVFTGRVSQADDVRGA